MLIPIENPSDPRIAEYASLNRATEGRDVRRGSTFVAEGELIARLAAGSRFPIRSMLMSSAKVDSMSDVIGSLSQSTSVYVAEPILMSEIVGFKFHRGALVCCERGGGLTLDEAVGGATSVVVLEQVSNFDNVGGIFRSVSALGGERPAVVLGPGCCDPLYRKCVRVSMGHALRVPFAEVTDLEQSLAFLANSGMAIVGLGTGATAMDLSELARDWQQGRRAALVVGAEGAGLRSETLTAIRRLGVMARIPMRAGVDSLNVGVAAAIAMYGIRSASGHAP